MSNTKSNPAMGLIGAGISTVGNIVNGYFQRQYDERIRNQEWSRSLEQWNRENAYNDPSAVTQRMKDAGINPALAYMNGASFAPAATSPDVGEVRSKGFGLQSDPMMIASLEVARAQADNLRADAEQKRSQVPVNEQTVANLQKQVEEMNEHMKVLQSQAAELDTRVGLNKSQQGYYMQLSNQTYEATRRLKATYDDFIAEVRAGREIKEAQARQIVAELKARRDALIAQATYYNAHANLTDSQKALIDKQIETYNQEFTKRMHEADARIADYYSQGGRRLVQNMKDATDMLVKPIELMQEQSNLFIRALDAAVPL